MSCFINNDLTIHLALILALRDILQENNICNFKKFICTPLYEWLYVIEATKS